MFEKFLNFFDKLETVVHRTLSRVPWVYALVGSIGIVLVWRGVWVMFDHLAFVSGIMDGILSLVFGVLILSVTGLFVSFFIGDQIIISGVKEEKRIDEKTEDEIREEELDIKDIDLRLVSAEDTIKKEKKRLDELDGHIEQMAKKLDHIIDLLEKKKRTAKK